jgi:type 1 glutamine amidotransferase
MVAADDVLRIEKARAMQLNRRHFLQRAAGSGCAIAASAALTALPFRAFAATAKEKAFRVCLLSGSEEYKSNESLAAYQKYLEKATPARCSRAFWKSKTDLPGLEALDDADLMVLFTRRLELPPEQLDTVRRYCQSGRPIVGIRTASHAFQNWLELDREILGGDYSGHYGSEFTTAIKIEKDAEKHAILKGFKPFESKSSLYKNRNIAKDTTLLLTGTIPEHTEPLAWTREHRGGRVFYTSLGGPEDFENQQFLTLLTNAILWAVHRSA